MDVYTIVLVLCMVTLSLGSQAAKVLNVLDFGAVGDGKTDDSKAFMKAWEAVCGGTSGSSDLLVPVRRIFLLNIAKFKGPCKSPTVHIAVRGKIIAPSKISEWRTPYMGSWIVFTRVNGLTVDGPGIIDGQGADWWNNCGTPPHTCPRPIGLKFDNCNNLRFSRLNLINSPSRYIQLVDCDNSTLSNFNILNPENSSNTDGIDISHSNNVQVRDSKIATGDDCIAILSGTSNLNITGVTCGPGHGISIGSMGHNGQNDTVEEIHVKNCTFLSSTNGARIKTWQGGVGFARKISFQDIILIGTQNPIHIDQFYCPEGGCANLTSAVKISDISFSGFQGTTTTDIAINLSCSQNLGCTNVVLEHNNITSADPKKRVSSYCFNAHGRSISTFPPDVYKIVLVLCVVTLSLGSDATKVLNVLDFGAVGDGKTNDAQAFVKGWKAVCGDETVSSTLLIPKERVFLLNTVEFTGPCKSPAVSILVEGNIVAPSKISEWGTIYKGSWICFSLVDGLTVSGSGTIDGKGAEWWNNCGTPPHTCPRPMGLRFNQCKNIEFSKLKLINSPSRYVDLFDCHNVTITNIKISNPENSSNTDGMDISHSTNVQVRDCTIGTGDDCIAIFSGTSNLNITGLKCGPGHGISIGSLGYKGANDTVEEIHVKNCTFLSTSNGARIKSWQGGIGYARKITYKDIILIGTQNPIHIDQFYCFDKGGCSNQTTAVQISNILFSGFRGTSKTDVAINLSCSRRLGCTNITLDHNNITSADPEKTVSSYCVNAHGTSIDTFPLVKCLN